MLRRVALMLLPAVLLAPSASLAAGSYCVGARVALGVSPTNVRMAVGCPMSEPPGQSKVSLRVVKWCNLPAPHDQVLFKFKPLLRNEGQQAINIGLTHWRLLVSEFVQGRWRPPPSSYPTGRPVVVRWAGRGWWAVPPNPDGAAEPDPFSEGGPTFATHWDGTYLGPGATYFRPANRQGDLVFYVPVNDRANRDNLMGDVALGYFVNRSPSVVVPSSEWGPKRPAGSF
jgi:hypothetical protein